VAIAALCETSGSRPSSLFNWNEEDEWKSRLLFDLYVIKQYMVRKAQEQDNASRH
jgi:hypothetical protein